MSPTLRDDFLETRIAKTAKMVRRWHGRLARMYELTFSHTTLTVLVYGDTPRENLVISCPGPEYIQGPTQWENSRIVLQTTTLPSGDEGIVLLDEENGVRVEAGSFEVRENVKLWPREDE